MIRNTFRNSLNITAAAVAISIGVGAGAQYAAAQTLTDPGLTVEAVTAPSALSLPTNMIILASNDFWSARKTTAR